MMKVAGVMAFTLYIGAARAAATPTQLAQLRAIDREQIRESTEGMRTYLLSVQAVMGSEWRPEGEWATVIERLLNNINENRSS